MKVKESLIIKPSQNHMATSRKKNILSLDKNMKSGIEKTESTFIRKGRYREEIIDALETANDKFIIYDRRFEFSIHDGTRQIMVKVIDASTDELIREIPPEKILDMAAAIWEAAGLFVDERI